MTPRSALTSGAGQRNVGPMKLHEGYFQDFDGTRLYYNHAGSGLPLVCCDGIACDQYAWKYLFGQFAKTHQVVRWNYRGHGRSDAPDDYDHLGISHLAEDLRLLLDHLGIDRAVLLGHSMGVQVILEFFHRFPGRTVALVPICGSFEKPLSTFHDSAFLERFLPVLSRFYERHTRVFVDLWRELLPTKLAFWVSVLVEVNYAMVKVEDFMPYLEHLSRMDLRLFFRMLQLANRHSARDWLEGVDVPVLIIGGEKDKFTPVHLSREMHELIPGSDLQILPGGSHTAPIEQPDLITLRLEKFLAQRLGDFAAAPWLAPAAAPASPGKSGGRGRPKRRRRLASTPNLAGGE